MTAFDNPFRPGAGHTPPYLAGRELERQEFLRLLKQKIILENVVLTGLRGVGKTVLLDSLKPLAIQDGWLWIGTDLSESTSVSEDNMAVRLCADLSVITSSVVIQSKDHIPPGFSSSIEKVQQTLNFNALFDIYRSTPGLALDKIKTTLELAWKVISSTKEVKGIIFAYDEAQNLSDQAIKEQYPLSLLLDTFQSLQKKNLPLMLVLTGLPTLFPKLVESRTFSERMFHVLFLKSLSVEESKEAILKPIANAKCPIRLSAESVNTIIEMSGGYPYFIQFICREVYDAFIQRIGNDQNASIPVKEIEQKLDTDFFSGRWAKATDRQRVLLTVIAELKNCEAEFSVQEITEKSKEILANPFTNSNVNQLLNVLSAQGLIFKNRHGKYSFAVPLLGRFIQRQRANIMQLNELPNSN
jgi:hypothetical protein